MTSPARAGRTDMTFTQGGHWLPLRKAICAATGKSDAGDEVDVVLRAAS